MTSQEKLAKILRTSSEVVLDIEEKMERITKKKGVINKIVEEIDNDIKKALEKLGLRNSPSGEKVFQALTEKAKSCDQALFKHFRKPEFDTTIGCQTVINSLKELTGDLPGFYLKEEKAKELLKLNPPKNIMASLGYGADVEKMLDKEDTFEIFSALRFVEDGDWLNNVFFKPYKDLTKKDFEKRKIKVMVLSERWAGIGKKFLGGKLHHMSHLKELGVVFVIPTGKQGIGETLYFFFMALHYLYETDWHAKLFEAYSSQDNFTSKMINALKVGVSDFPLPNKGKASWRIVAKYLAKKDPNDPRLFEPHVSPESWHYTEAGLAIQKLASRFPELELDFWKGLDEVGGSFQSKSSKENIFVSFNLYDNGIDVLRQSGIDSDFLYHQQEALWNKIFEEYTGIDDLEKLIIKNFDKGVISL